MTDVTVSSASALASTQPRVPCHVRTRRTGHEVVVVDLLTERYFGLDGVGSDLWRLLTGGHSVPAAVDRLVQRYDVDPEVLRQDLEELVATLLDRGLLTTVEPAPGVGIGPAVEIETHMEVGLAAAPVPAREGTT